jgi:hypothetical protein
MHHWGKLLQIPVASIQLVHGGGSMTVRCSEDRGRSVAPTAAVNSAAYCGEAHGAKWCSDAVPPADIVELAVGGESAVYRLVRHPRNGQPAVDRHNRFLYVPASEAWRKLVSYRTGRATR